jgi:hypothetical protein
VSQSSLATQAIDSKAFSNASEKKVFAYIQELNFPFPPDNEKFTK